MEYASSQVVKRNWSTVVTLEGFPVPAVVPRQIPLAFDTFVFKFILPEKHQQKQSKTYFDVRDDVNPCWKTS